MRTRMMVMVLMIAMMMMKKHNSQSGVSYSHRSEVIWNLIELTEVRSAKCYRTNSKISRISGFQNGSKMLNTPLRHISVSHVAAPTFRRPTSPPKRQHVSEKRIEKTHPNELLLVISCYSCSFLKLFSSSPKRHVFTSCGVNCSLSRTGWKGKSSSFSFNLEERNRLLRLHLKA